MIPTLMTSNSHSALVSNAAVVLVVADDAVVVAAAAADDVGVVVVVVAAAAVDIVLVPVHGGGDVGAHDHAPVHSATDAAFAVRRWRLIFLPYSVQCVCTAMRM